MRRPTVAETRAVLASAIGLACAASFWRSHVADADAGSVKNLSDAAVLATALVAVLGAARRSVRDDAYDALSSLAPVLALLVACALDGPTRAGRAAATRARALSASATVAYVDAWTSNSPRKNVLSSCGWVLVMRVLTGSFSPEAIAVACARACAWALDGAAAQSETTALSIGFAVAIEWCGSMYFDTQSKYSDASVLGGAYALAGCALLLASARLVCWPDPANRATQLGVIGVALAVPEGFYRAVSKHSNESMVSGLIRYVTTSNDREALVSLASLWTAGVAVAVTVAYNARSIPITMRRKAFHFLAVAMFAPTLTATSAHGELIRVAFAVAFALFSAVECARVFDAYYGHGLFGWKLSVLLAQFVGDSVVSLVILDHFSLLLGVAVPAWLSADRRSLAQWAGVLTLGVGDSFASIIGSTFGRTRVFGDKTYKTLEGSIAFAASTYVAARVVDADVSATRLAVACVVTALCELSIEGTDNLAIPLIFAALARAS